MNEDSIGDLKVTYETIDGFTEGKGMEVSAIGKQYTNKRLKQVIIE